MVTPADPVIDLPAARRLREIGHSDALIVAATGVPAASMRNWPVDRDAWRRWSADHPADAQRLKALIRATFDRRHRWAA